MTGNFIERRGNEGVEDGLQEHRGANREEKRLKEEHSGEEITKRERNWKELGGIGIGDCVFSVHGL